MAKRVTALSGSVLDDQTRFTLRELCSACGVNAEIIIEMVAEGVIDPQGSTPIDWCFSGPSVIRVQTALRLQRDLRLNLPGAALVLDLLDELEELRHITIGIRNP